MRRICYISGTRADFGLMRSTLQTIRDHPALAVEVIATTSGMAELKRSLRERPRFD
jgi:GDP/UDP-N,N'-diacetylbacillosamine 2-epimerase (hydrolysing)